LVVVVVVVDLAYQIKLLTLACTKSLKNTVFSTFITLNDTVVK